MCAAQQREDARWIAQRTMRCAGQAQCPMESVLTGWLESHSDDSFASGSSCASGLRMPRSLSHSLKLRGGGGGPQVSSIVSQFYRLYQLEHRDTEVNNLCDRDYCGVLLGPMEASLARADEQARKHEAKMRAREQARAEKQAALDAAGVPKQSDRVKHVKKIVSTSERRREHMRKPNEEEEEERQLDGAR